MPLVMPQWKALKHNNRLLEMPPPQHLQLPPQHQNPLKMQQGFGTTPARRVVLEEEARPLPVLIAAPPLSTTQLTTHLPTPRLPLLTVPLLFQKALPQRITPHRHQSPHRMQKASGITPAQVVVQEVLVRPLLAQNVERRWRTTKPITSNDSG